MMLNIMQKKFCNISTIDRGNMLIELRDKQRDALKIFSRKNEILEFNYLHPKTGEKLPQKYFLNAKDIRFSLLKFSRQFGKSTIYSIYLNHYSGFNFDKTAGLLANKGDVAREILGRVQYTYLKLPLWLKQGVIIWNKGNIELENDCRVITSGTTENAFSGYTLSLLVIDEISKLPQNIIKALWKSLLPTITSGITSQIIGTSTPKGENFFKELWDGAYLNMTSNVPDDEKCEDFIPLEATYKDIPERNNEKWVRSEKKKLKSEKAFLQEHMGLFVAIDNIYIDGVKVSQLMPKSIIKKDKNEFIEKKLKKYIESISTYYKPIKGHKYILSIDPSEMTSKSKEGDNDNIGMHILDVTDIRNKFKQSLSINFTEGFNYLESTLIIYILGTYYNNALVIGENNMGKQILNDLKKDYQYENIYSEKPEILGYRCTKSNKPLLCKLLKHLIENDLIEINDNDTIQELKTFTTDLKAMPGYTDGLVTSLLAAIYFLLWSQHKIENLIGTEEEGVYIKTGKDLLQVTLELSDNIEDTEMNDIITQYDNINDEIANELLEKYGFKKKSNDGLSIII